jgi:hypothetical protein
MLMRTAETKIYYFTVIGARQPRFCITGIGGVTSLIVRLLQYYNAKTLLLLCVNFNTRNKRVGSKK